MQVYIDMDEWYTWFVTRDDSNVPNGAHKVDAPAELVERYFTTQAAWLEARDAFYDAIESQLPKDF